MGVPTHMHRGIILNRLGGFSKYKYKIGKGTYLGDIEGVRVKMGLDATIFHYICGCNSFKIIFYLN